MYEFVCDRIIPGCNYTERGERRAELEDKARQHLLEHHEHGRTRKDWGAEVIDAAMIYLPR